jgi:hypothetical protein
MVMHRGNDKDAFAVCVWVGALAAQARLPSVMNEAVRVVFVEPRRTSTMEWRPVLPYGRPRARDVIIPQELIALWRSECIEEGR